MITLADLTLEQRRAFVTALLFIATIDDEYHPAEQAFVHSALVAAKLPPSDEVELEKLLRSRPSLDDVLAPVKETPVARLLVRELISLAHADAAYVDAERSGVAMISDKLGLARSWLTAMEAWVAEGVAWQKRGAELVDSS